MRSRQISVETGLAELSISVHAACAVKRRGSQVDAKRHADLQQGEKAKPKDWAARANGRKFEKRLNALLMRETYADNSVVC